MSKKQTYIALFVIFTLMLSFGGIANAQDDEVVTLRWLIRGAPQPDTDTVEAALNVLLEERIGVNIELDFIDKGAFNDTMSLINVSGEDYDLVFTAPWANNYYTNVQQEFIMPLDDLLVEHAPELYESIPDSIWDATRVNGQIYGVVNQQIFVRPIGPTFRADIVEELELQDEIDAVETWTDLTPLFETLNEYVQTDDTLRYVLSGMVEFMEPNAWGYDEVLPGIVVKADDESATAVFWADTPEFAEAARLARLWQESGFMAPEEPDNEQIQQGWRAGQYAVHFQVQKPGLEVENLVLYERETVGHTISEPILTTTGTIATMTGISTTSDHPEEAMAFLNLIHTDPIIFNTLARGVEGVHWNFVDEEINLVELVADSGYAPGIDWTLGNTFIAYPTDPSTLSVATDTQDLNNNSFASSILGFALDVSELDTELAILSTIENEFFIPLRYGLLPADEGIERYQNALNDANMQSVIDEVNAQIDAWQSGE